MGKRNDGGVRTETRRGVHTLVIDFTFRDSDGRAQRYRRDATVQQRGSALAEAARLRRLAVANGTLDIAPQVQTFAAFVATDFRPLAMARYSPATRERYERVLTAPGGLIELLGSVRIDAIGARELRLVEAEHHRRGTSPRQALILAHGIIRVAVEHGKLTQMPVLPKHPKAPRKLPACPSVGDVRRLLESATGWLRVAVAVAALGGLRNGEARALRAGDVDIQTGLLCVRRAYSHHEIRSPKSKLERVIPMGDLLRGILAEAVRGKRPTDTLVVTEDGRTPSRQALYKSFTSLCRRAGLARTWSFHSLRHAFGTHALRAGANVEAVRELLGHRDLATTSGYLHALAADKPSATEALNRQLVGNATEPNHVTA